MKRDAMINGVMPKRGMYLIHRGKGKTYGRVTRVLDEVVVWFGATGADVRSDPDKLRERGYEYSATPLPGYVAPRPFPYDNHPERGPEVK